MSMGHTKEVQVQESVEYDTGSVLYVCGVTTARQPSDHDAILPNVPRTPPRTYILPYACSHLRHTKLLQIQLHI
jgi:hypothetical protein